MEGLWSWTCVRSSSSSRQDSALGALLEYLCARCEVVDLALAGRDVPAYLERMNFFRSFGERVRTNADVASLEERQAQPGRCRS